MINSTLRILIVEDEALIADEIQDWLSRLGYEIAAVADTAKKAVEAVKKHRPDLVLMDIRLKGPGDGIDAASVIREEFRLPVVYLTAHSDRATLNRAKETSPFGYLLKPFQERELLVAIEMAIHMHELEERVTARTNELEETVAKLQKALNEVKVLRGLLPICAWCGKMRDDKQYWLTVEDFLATHTDAQLTHGICPHCLEKAREGAAGQG